MKDSSAPSGVFRRPGSILRQALAIVWLPWLTVNLHAATRFATWIGTTDSDWENPANWREGRVPNNTATETFSVVWEDHPVTVRVRGNVTVDTFRFASGGVLELANQSVTFDVRNRFEWTQGTVGGEWIPGNPGTTARLTAHGDALFRTQVPDRLTLRGVCDLVLKDFCNLESVLQFDGAVSLHVETTARLHARPGAGLLYVGGVPMIFNDGLISIYSDTQPFATLPISSTGRIFVGARTVEISPPFSEDTLIHVSDGLLHLEESTLHGHVQLDEGEIQGSGYIQSAEANDPISGRLQFGELALGATTWMTFVIGRPHDRIQVAGALTLDSATPILKLARGFVPGPDDEFEIVRAAGGIRGQFKDFNFAPIAFGTRRDVIGFVGPGPATAIVGSFLLELTPDSRAVVLRNFLPPPVKLGDGRLEYRLPQPEAGEVGGCFVVPHAAIDLPAANWDGGRVEVKIAERYVEGIDVLSFRRNRDFPDSASLRFVDLPEGGWTVSFRGTAFGTARIEGPQMTCELNDQAGAEAIVALLGWMHYGNRELTPDWFKQASDRYPSRTILTTLTDGSGNQTQVAREITFSHLVGISLESGVSLVAPDSTILHLQGVFSNGQELPVPYLETLWRDGCPSPSEAVGGFPGRRIVKGLAEGSCCVLAAAAGPFTAETKVFAAKRSPLFGIELCFGGLLGCCVLGYFYFVPDCAPLPAPTSSRHGPDAPQPPLSLATFYTLQSLMKQSAGGQRLVDLYWQHTAEVVRIVFSHATLREQAKAVLTTFQPGVTALLAGRGADFTITQPMIDQLNVVWTGLANLASPALKTALLREQENYGRFQTFVNRDFARWADLLSLPAPARPYLHLSSATRTGTRFTVEINDVPGVDFTLWRSPDLRNWQPVPGAETVRDGFTARFTDPAPLAREVFYTIRLQAPD